MVENLSESLAVRLTFTERREFEAAAAAKNMRPSVALRLAMSLFVDQHRANSADLQRREPTDQ